jgi:putative membrane protein
MMRIIQLASFEFRRQRQPIQRLAIAFLLAVPLLYGALYLWSNWDPYGKTSQMPVAVVNGDRPVRAAGTTVYAGGMFVSALRRDRIFDWHFTTASDASTGLSTGRYEIAIWVPRDFSANLASGATGTPRRATVAMRVDDGNGYLIGIMARTVKDQITQRVDQAATAAYFESVFGSLDRLRRGLATAHDGAAALRDGLAPEQSGARRLASGLRQLDAASGRLATGAAQVAAGNRELADVLVPAANQLAAALPGLAQQATAVTAAAATLSGQVNQGADTLSSRQQALVDAIDQFGRDHPAIGDSAGYQRILQAAQAVSDRVNAVSRTTATVNDNAQRLAQASRALSRQVPSLQRQLTAGASKIQHLASGATRVASGAQQLHDGIGRAAAAAQQLDSGAARLHGGAVSLTSGLATLVNRLPNLSSEQKQRNAQILGSPARVTLTAAHPAKVYGRGLAPFFFAIALWVFGIAAFLVLRPISGRMLAGRAAAVTIAVAAWLPVLTVGALGGLILLAAVQAGLGLDPVHPGWTIGLIVLAAATFTAIAHMLRVAVGVVGTAITLVLLMLQITSCAGIYPVQTLPAFFRALHPVLPMSYLVDGLRITFTGGYTPHLARDLAVIAAYGLAALAGTTLLIARRRTWTLRQLHPVLQE